MQVRIKPLQVYVRACGLHYLDTFNELFIHSIFRVEQSFGTK